MRVILILKGFYPNIDPSVVGEFQYKPEFDAYVWRGEPLSVEQFNTKFSDWLKTQSRTRSPEVLDVRIVSGEVAPQTTLEESAPPSAEDLIQSAEQAEPPKPKRPKKPKSED